MRILATTAIKRAPCNILRILLLSRMACYRVVFAALQLVAFLHCASSVRVDKTLEERARGTPVVFATVNKIRESGIFSDDYQFLRRMAAVETDDGETFTPGTGGIWKVSEDVFNDVQSYMLSAQGQSSLAMTIETTFSLDWVESIAKREDLDIPFYSALTVMIHIEMSRADMTYEIPHDIPSQAIIWNNNFNENGDPEDFISIADQLEMEGKLHNILLFPVAVSECGIMH